MPPALSRRRWWLLSPVAALVGLVAVTTVVLVQGRDQRDLELLVWFDQTASAVREQGAPDAAASRTWALAWWAADRAVTGTSPAFDAAAVASAVHDVLLATVPARASPLDRALRDSLDQAGDGPAAARGAQAGREQARAVLAERAGDGLTADRLQGPFTPPPLAPGVWRPTPPGYQEAVEVRQESARPFVLTSPGQLRPGPPPAVGSPDAVRDLAEVRDVGAAEGSQRSPEQEEVARFWELSQVEAFTRLIRPELVARGTSLTDGAHLLSVLHRVAADAEIAVFEAKYVYLHWRPVTALAEGAPGPGAGGVSPAPDWQPLIVTPAHPEYPSAHTVYAGAVVTVLSSLLGGEPIGLSAVTSASTAGVTRSFTTWDGVLRENEDARVYAGIHFRTSDEVGTDLGRAVAQAALGG